MGGIRGKSFLIPRIKIVRERKMLISAKLNILCSENCHIYINCMQTKFSTRQKKNNPILLLMLIWRDLSLKEAFYDLHYFWIGAQYQGSYLYYVAILFKDSMIIDVTKSTISVQHYLLDCLWAKWKERLLYYQTVLIRQK